jgi:hypothetical protein
MAIRFARARVREADNHVRFVGEFLERASGAGQGRARRGLEGGADRPTVARLGRAAGRGRGPGAPSASLLAKVPAGEPGEKRVIAPFAPAASRPAPPRDAARAVHRPTPANKTRNSAAPTARS